MEPFGVWEIFRGSDEGCVRTKGACFSRKYKFFEIVFIYIDWRVEQKVLERGFLCVSLWVCNKQSRLKFFF